MRAGPLIVIIVFVLLVSATLGSTFLWVVSGIAVCALVALIIVMARADRFVGPRVIVDDFSRKLESYGRDPVVAEVPAVVEVPVADDLTRRPTDGPEHIVPARPASQEE